VVDNETCVLADNKCHVEWPGGNQPQIAGNRGGVEDSGDYSGVPEPVNRESRFFIVSSNCRFGNGRLLDVFGRGLV